MPKMISTDSHVMEPDELWQELTPRLREQLPKVPFRNSPPGAIDPHLRLRDQDTDGVAAEVLFPNYGMALFGIDDIETQQESFKLYNDWMRDFCETDPKRLYGAPLVSVYDIKAGIKEMQRGHDMGLKGAMLWQVPDPRLPFTDPHYEPLWAACAEAGAPVICHILTGHSYIKTGQKGGSGPQGRDQREDERFRQYAVRFHLLRRVRPPSQAASAAGRKRDRLAAVPAAAVGLLFRALPPGSRLPIKRKPSEIFDEHVYGTFLEDYVGTRFFPWWGEKNCMWSNDYPHFNMTFPHSRQVVEYHLNGLSEEKRQRLTRDNAIELFGLKI